MIFQILTSIFGATGVFTGAADCSRLSDIVIAEVYLRVESNSPRVPADSISRSLERLSVYSKKKNFKSSVIIPDAGEEGKNRKTEKGNEKEYFASKSLKIKSTNVAEIREILQSAAEFGFTMNRKPEYQLSKKR